MLLCTLIVILIRCLHVTMQGPKTEIDLLQGVGVETKFGVTYTTGWDGYPTFLFTPQAYIREPAQVLFPKPLFGEFVISMTIKPYTGKGGFIIAVLNPHESIVQLGVQIQVYNNTHQKLVLYLTPFLRSAEPFTTVANFTVPSMVQKWTRVVFEVLQSRIVLYCNCQMYEQVRWVRPVDNLEFEPGSWLYIGQAGPNFATEPNYMGVLQQLKISNGTRNAEDDTCDFDIDGSGSGDEEIKETTTREPDPQSLPETNKGKGERGGEGLPEIQQPPNTPPPRPLVKKGLFSSDLQLMILQ